MRLTKRAALSLLAALVVLIPAIFAVVTHAASAALPTPDFADLPAYIRALNQSHNPQAVAIRRQIAAGPASLARERAAAQADGIPLDIKQEAAAVPPDQNAAPLWQRWNAMRHGHVRLPTYAETLRVGYAYTPEQLARVQKIFDDNRAAMDLLHQAADKPAFVISGDAISYYAPLREAARELRSESYLLAHQGRYADAIADQARGFRIAKQIASPPSLVDYLVGEAIEGITLSGMRDILSLAGPNADVSAQVQAALQAAQPVLSLRSALVGETAYSLSRLGKLRTGTPADLALWAQEAADPFATTAPPVKAHTFTPEERRFVNHMLDAAEADYLSRMRRLVDAAAASGPRRHAVFAALQNSDLPATPNPVLWLDPARPLNHILLPTFGPMDEVDNEIHAQEEVTLAGAAVLAERAALGAFPATLPDGSPDPFTGGPLGYRREGDAGFVVYSVGPDGQFDGGQPGDDRYDPKHAFFRYPGPTPRPVPAEDQ